MPKPKQEESKEKVHTHEKQVQYTDFVSQSFYFWRYFKNFITNHTKFKKRAIKVPNFKNNFFDFFQRHTSSMGCIVIEKIPKMELPYFTIISCLHNFVKKAPTMIAGAF